METSVGLSLIVGTSQTVPPGSNIDAHPSHLDRRKGIAQAENFVNHEAGSEEKVEGLLSYKKRKLHVGASCVIDIGETLIFARNYSDSFSDCIFTLHVSSLL